MPIHEEFPLTNSVAVLAWGSSHPRVAMRIALFALLPLSIAGAQAEWPVAPKPIVDIPGVDASGNEVFQNLAGAVRLSNGYLIVADKGSTSIRLIDPSGKLIKSVGRQGQ